MGLELSSRKFCRRDLITPVLGAFTVQGNAVDFTFLLSFFLVAIILRVSRSELDNVVIVAKLVLEISEIVA